MTASLGKHRILLVEDHTILREGLRSLLRAYTAWEVVGEAADGLEAIAQARRLQPDLIIMDLSMPKMSGVEAMREITRQHPKIKILALTMHNTEEHLRDVLRAGAVGFMVKSASHDELVAAVRSVLAGQRYLSPQVAKSAVEDDGENPVLPRSLLGTRSPPASARS